MRLAIAASVQSGRELRVSPLAIFRLGATTRIGGVDIVMRRQVQVPRSLHSNLQRRIVFFDSKMPLLNSIRLP
jgi:hypothetical protein